MKPQHVELIVALFEEGSVGAAARRLNRTQPAITKALKTVERDLGSRLFYRGSHGVTPTLEGQRVIERCRRILRDLMLLDEDVFQMRGELVGTINVIVSPVAAIRIMPSVLQRYTARYPGVRLEVTGGHPPKAFQPLRTGQADFVIGPAPTPGDDTGLNSETVLTTDISILTGAGSKYIGVKDLEVLSRANWVMIGSRDRKPIYHDLFETNGLSAPTAVICSDSILTILSTIEGTDLLCSFPSLVLPALSGNWKIATLELDQELPMVSIALTSAQGRILTPAASAFADLVREEAAKQKLEIS